MQKGIPNIYVNANVHTIYSIHTGTSIQNQQN